MLTSCSQPLAPLPLSWSGKRSRAATLRRSAVVLRIFRTTNRTAASNCSAATCSGTAPAIHLHGVQSGTSLAEIGFGAAGFPEPAADEYGYAHSSELGHDESRHG